MVTGLRGLRRLATSKKPDVMSTGITKQWERSNPFMEKGSSEETRYLLVGKKKKKGATELEAGVISSSGPTQCKAGKGTGRTNLQCGETRLVEVWGNGMPRADGPPVKVSHCR